MKRNRKSLLLCTTLALAACGSASDARSAGESGEVDLAHTTAMTSVDGDPLAARADSLVRAGRPWRATALLATALRTPASASPEVRLAGARAAAAWDGWTEVDRILRGADWLDRTLGGEGRELLARSGLERGQESVMDARLALDAAKDDGARVVRRVLLARAYDRANTRDSAASNYLAAAGRLPRVADWLRLRAAGVLSDSSSRADLFRRVTNPQARERIASTDAQARERTGDFVGASRVYQSAGAMGAAFRAASLGATDPAAKAAVAARMVTYLGGSPGSADARQTLELLDKLGITLSPAQQLIVARATAEHGAAARAVAAFDRARSSAPLVARDQYTYAGALLRAGRSADAARQFSLVTGDATLTATSAYQRARALLAGNDGAGARAALRDVATRYATTRAAAAPALLLLADLQVDDGDLAGAAASLGELATQHPDASQAPLARFRGGLLAWNRAPRQAAAAFDSLIARYPADEEATPARYWAARACEKAGDKGAAATRWRQIIAESPLSYYAGLSARRLGTAGWTPPAGPDSAVHIAAVDSVASRIALLQRLGMDVEARFEMDALAERADKAPAIAAPVAQALVAAGEPSRASTVAARALSKGPHTRALLRAAYPVLHTDALAEESKRNGLDPALVAGLIRQESSWNPRAVSPVGARGLMQLMPPVGAAIAASHRYPVWNPALLFEPDVSLELGTAHLASSLRRGAPPARALAAYNAGASRVTRWSSRPGADDPELFSEWIPFTETRDYVRLVQRNAAVYEALYGLKPE